jgi:hypothetical protein
MVSGRRSGFVFGNFQVQDREVYRGFPQYLQANVGMCLELVTTASFHMLLNSSFTFHRFIRRHIF